MLTTPNLLRYTVLAIWAITLIGAFLLRLNSKRVHPTVLRYLAYLGYTNPKHLSTPPVAAAYVAPAAKSNVAY